MASVEEAEETAAGSEDVEEEEEMMVGLTSGSAEAFPVAEGGEKATEVGESDAEGDVERMEEVWKGEVPPVEEGAPPPPVTTLPLPEDRAAADA